MVNSITSLDDFHAKIAGDTPVLIDFWATWCGPCRVISPIFERISKEVKGVEFYKVDVDVQSTISQEVGIRAMPTFMLFKNGKKEGELVGAVPNKLEELVRTATSLVGTPKVAEKSDTSSVVESTSTEKPITACSSCSCGRADPAGQAA